MVSAKITSCPELKTWLIAIGLTTEFRDDILELFQTVKMLCNDSQQPNGHLNQFIRNHQNEIYPSDREKLERANQSLTKILQKLVHAHKNITVLQRIKNMSISDQELCWRSSEDGRKDSNNHQDLNFSNLSEGDSSVFDDSLPPRSVSIPGDESGFVSLPVPTKENSPGTKPHKGFFKRVNKLATKFGFAQNGTNKSAPTSPSAKRRSVGGNGEIIVQVKINVSSKKAKI